jgi:hypothetical protein
MWVYLEYSVYSRALKLSNRGVPPYPLHRRTHPVTPLVSPTHYIVVISDHLTYVHSFVIVNPSNRITVRFPVVNTVLLYKGTYHV